MLVIVENSKTVYWKNNKKWKMKNLVFSLLKKKNSKNSLQLFSEQKVSVKYKYCYMSDLIEWKI